PRSGGVSWLPPEKYRDGIAVEDSPSRLFEHPFRQTAVGPDPDHVDAIAVADGVPGRPAGERLHVFKDRVLAEELEPVVEVGQPRGLTFRFDQAAPVLLVEEARRRRL